MFTVTLDIPRFDKSLRKVLDGHVKRIEKALNTFSDDGGDYIKQKVAELVPVKSGDLKGLILNLPIKKKSFSLSFDGARSNPKLEVRIPIVGRKNKKIIWVNNGTGLYGPHSHRIVPRHSKFLKFEIDGEIIFARSVRGQKGQFFLERGIKASASGLRNKLVKYIKGL
jgi:hypothetical protein